MKRAVIYIRESTNKQDESPEVQEAQANAYALMRDLTIVKIVHDAETSAGKPFLTRPHAPEVNAMIMGKRVDHVIATKLDRMFRDVVDCLTNVDRWDKTGVSLHLLDMGGSAVDTKSPAGRFMLTVLAGAAEWERRRIGERTKEALAHKRRKGEVYGALPFGFGREGNMLVPHVGQQATLVLMRKLREDGMSFDAIAEELLVTRVPTARGGRWRGNTVREILRRDAEAA